MRVHQSLLSKFATAFAVAVIAPSLLADTPVVTNKTWFTETVTGYEAMPANNDVTTAGGTWTIPNDDESELVATGISLSTGDNPLIYTPSASSHAPYPVTMTFDVQFTSTTELPDVPDGAQLAVTAANTNNTGAAYYIYLGSGTTWTRLYGATPGSTSVPVVVNINYETHKATVSVGSTPTLLYLDENDSSTTELTIPSDKTQVNSLAFAGSGVLGNFSGVDSRAALYAIGTTNYEDFDSATNAWQSGDTLLAWSESEGTWSTSPVTYTVTFDPDNGSAATSSSYNYGTPAANVTVPADPTKSATAQYTYTFAAWTPAIVDVFAEATYTATYTETVNEYTISWDTDADGTVDDTTTVAYGTVPTHADGAKTGDAQYTYTFTGWDVEPVAVTGVATYTATFSTAVNEYTISWDTDGDGDVDDTTMVAYGTVPTHANGSKDADAQYTYTFTGWDVEPVAVTGPATYTATFSTTVNQYTITWSVNGVETTSQVAYGETPAYDGTPTKPEDETNTYTFAGWDPEIASVTGPATYTATFTPVPKPATVMSIALQTNAVDTVRNGTLAATSATGKDVTVKAMIGLSGQGAAPAVTASPDGTVSVADGIATATFATNWNAGVEWTLTSGAKTLVGKTYAKGEAEWFTTNAADVVAVENLGFGDTCPVGVKPAESTATNEAVRIEARIAVTSSGSSEPPALDAIEDARGGFAVVNYEYVAFNGDAWVGLFGVTPIDGEVDLLMVADMAGETPTVRYYVDGVSLWTTNSTPDARVYAVPLKQVQEGNNTLQAVGFSSAEIVKSAVVAEYDVSYVAAIGNNAYATEAVAVAAVDAADKTDSNNPVILEILKADFVGNITLAAGESLKIDTTNGTYIGTVSTSAPASKVKAVTAGNITTYTVVITPTYFIID